MSRQLVEGGSEAMNWSAPSLMIEERSSFSGAPITRTICSSWLRGSVPGGRRGRGVSRLARGRERKGFGGGGGAAAELCGVGEAVRAGAGWAFALGGVGTLEESFSGEELCDDASGGPHVDRSTV